MTELELHGFRYSVYTWIVRFALVEKGLEYRAIEVNPFSEEGHPAHPFGKVPLFVDKGFRVYETSAITRYLDAAFPEPSFQPRDIKERARSDQVIAVIDNYAYWPLVRQIFSQGYFNRAFGLEVDQAELSRGLNTSPQVLAALNELIAEQGILTTGQLSLADIHLGPVISYVDMAPEGATLLKSYPKLSLWWNEISKRPGMAQSKPELPR